MWCLPRPRRTHRVATLSAALLAAGVAHAQQAPAAPSPATAHVPPPAVIALRHVTLPDDMPDAARAHATFDSLMTAMLTAAGYRVVPGATTTVAWKAAVDSIGGYYDRSTGKLIREKFLAASTSTIGRLHASHGADALLTPLIGTEVVRTSRGKAQWEGTSQQVDHGGWGTVGVLTLHVITTDSAGTVVHCGSGGIRALVKFSYLKNDAKPLPPTEYFADHKRNEAAVRRALESLLARTPTCDRQ
jgi:hypothetical protein